MAMSLYDYFQLRASEMLVMERDIWQMNNLMAQEVSDPKIKEAFERHSDPTRQQISNLEQVVDRFGGITGPQENPVTQGMMRAHRQFMDMNPSQELIDIHDALEGDKVEHLEMAAYTGLIRLAQELGETEVVEFLQQNLTGEQRMCTVLEGETPRVIGRVEHRRAA